MRKNYFSRRRNRKRYSNFHRVWWDGEPFKLFRRRHKAKLIYEPIDGQNYVNVRFK